MMLMFALVLRFVSLLRSLTNTIAYDSQIRIPFYSFNVNFYAIFGSVSLTLRNRPSK